MPGMPWSDKEIEILEKHMKKDVERVGLQWINEVVDDLASQGYNRRIKTLYGYRTHPSNHYLKHCVILRELIEQDPPAFSGKRGEKEQYAQEKAALAQAKLIEEGIDMPLHKLAISARTMITGNKIEKKKKVQVDIQRSNIKSYFAESSIYSGSYRHCTLDVCEVCDNV